MITSNDLKEWGMQEGSAFGVALKIFNGPKVTIGKARAEELVKAVLADPDSYVGHAVAAPIVKELMKCRKAAKGSVRLNESGCPLEVFGAEMIEPGAFGQIHMAAKLPISVRAAMMPDAHEGYGLPIGGVLAVDNAVIPFAVGVDIGCRMQMTVFDVPGKMVAGMRCMLENVLKETTVFGAGIDIGMDIDHPVLDDERFEIPRVKKLNLRSVARRQIGTSGGGNHFVEFGVLSMEGFDEPKLALLSHSGSRGMGNKIGLMYSDLAIEKCGLQGDAKRLSWLSMDDPDGREYWAAMELSGRFAEACHEVIHGRVAKALGEKSLKTIQNHHNFAWMEEVDGRKVVVHRKGATPAGVGVLGLIPGSMTTMTCVVRGKGNLKSMCSSSHGAGRLMSRKAAKEAFTLSSVVENLRVAGVDLIGGSVDECSMAYKDIEAVMRAQSDLVEVVGKFKPMVVRMAEGSAKPWEKE